MALDQPPEGYVLANPENAKAVMAELVAGGKARLSGQADWLSSSKLPLATDGAVTLTITEQNAKPGAFELVYHPKTLVLGMGCERGAPTEDAIALAEKALAEGGYSHKSLAAVTSLELKADEAAI